jgi:3-hydroxy-9,10-secoandrosta-1,3,5(10)-triene-9,17-dione monooxygenase reductase component
MTTARDPTRDAQFRQVLGHFATGLSLLTAPGPVGMTVQALMSLSLDPPLIALGIGRQSRAWPSVRRAGVFCLNLLTDEQEALAWRFGRPGGDKFDRVAWRSGPNDIPELTEAHAWIDCAIRDEHDGGDHHLVVASVLGLRVGSGAPLIFHRGRAKRLGLRGGNQA